MNNFCYHLHQFYQILNKIMNLENISECSKRMLFLVINIWLTNFTYTHSWKSQYENLSSVIQSWLHKSWLHGLSLCLRQQGFETNLLQKSCNKFFDRHGLIIEKYGAALREMRLAIHAWIAPWYPYIPYLLLIDLYFSCILVRMRAQFYFVHVHYLFI